MSYGELIMQMKAYRCGRITREELTCAIGLWQASGAAR